MTPHLQTSRKGDKKLRGHISSFKAFKRLLLPLVRSGTDSFHRVQTDDASSAMHELRVTLRRMRSLLSAFEDYLPAGHARYWRKQLSHASDVAGATRSWDVIIEDTLPEAEQAVATPLHELRKALQHVRNQQRTLSLHELREFKLDELLQDSMSARHLLDKGRWRHPDRNISTVAVQGLEQAHDEVAKRIRRLGDGQLEELHRIRIAIKRLRYLTEFFAPVLKKKQKRPLQVLARLQARLGALNDKAEARAQLDSLPENSRTAHEVALVKDWLDRSIEKQARLLRLRLRNDTLLLGR